MRIEQYQWICNRLAEIIERLPSKYPDGPSDAVEVASRALFGCPFCGGGASPPHVALYEEADLAAADKRIAELNEALALAHAILAKMQPGKVACAAKRAAIKHDGDDPIGYIAGVLANGRDKRDQ